MSLCENSKPMMTESSGNLTLKDLFQLFECPVCLEIKHPEYLTLCRNGHTICFDCVSMLEVCPVCRRAFDKFAWTLSEESTSNLNNELRHLETFQSVINICRLQDFFQCSWCKFVPTRRQINQCNQGHIICIECHSELSVCNTCQPDIINYTEFRSLLTEKILSLVCKHCRYKENGCNKTIFDFSEHEKFECSHQVVKCFFTFCCLEVPMMKFQDHLKEFNFNHIDLLHPLEENLGENCSTSRGFLQIPEEYPNKQYYSFIETGIWNKTCYLKLNDDDHFCMQMMASKLHKTSYFWVYYLGTQIEADRFSYKLKLFTNNSRKKILVNGATFSVSEHFHKLIFRGSKFKPFKLTFEEIKGFWDQSTVYLFWEIQVFESPASSPATALPNVIMKPN